MMMTIIPIVVTPVGIVTDVSDVQQEKAASPNDREGQFQSDNDDNDDDTNSSDTSRNSNERQ